MKRIFLYIIIMCCPLSMGAQHITRTFMNRPLSEVLTTLRDAQSAYAISFIHNELEHLSVNATLKDLPVPKAVERICKGLPVKVKVKGTDIFVQYKGKEEARTDSVTALIPVVDAFTGKPIIDDGRVEVLTEDSVYVTDGSWVYNTNNGVRTATFADVKVPKKSGHYLLRLVHDRYFPLYYPLHLRVVRQTESFMMLSEKAKLRRRPKDVQLNEVVVQATKVKMYYRGDTIVYDADAFQLSRGSMLDALIEQLPGATLDEHGVITVNGRYVSSLLVNGKDFFKGDPAIALQNLPAYMVDKIKVYEKESDLERMTGWKETVRPLVMDVNLKKQYSIGWIANAEAAYGTEARWLGRLFALRFTDCSRLSLFGNANNTNDTRRPGARGEWTPSYLPSGLQTSRTGGAEYYYENRMKTFEWTSNLHARHSDNHTVGSTTSESFLPSGRAFSVQEHDERNRSASVNSQHSFKAEKGSLRQNGSVRFSYDRNRIASSSRTGEFSGDPYVWPGGSVLDSLFHSGTTNIQKLARYRRAREILSRGDNWSITVPYHQWWFPFQHIGIMDMIFFDVSGSWDRHTYHYFDRNNLEYAPVGTGSRDYQNRYYDSPSWHYNYNAKIEYVKWFDNVLEFQLRYRYNEDYDKGIADLFRLDRLEGWGTDTDTDLGALPSASSELQQVLDLQNSAHSELWKRKHQTELCMEYRWRKSKKTQTTLRVQLPVNIEQHHLVYDRSLRHFDLHRTRHYLTPQGYLNHEFYGKGGDPRKLFTLCQIDYSLSYSVPELVKGIELVNDANPLYVQYGNPGLKPGITHNLSYKMNTMRNLAPLYDLNLSYRKKNDALAMERTYNPETGGYRVRPVNVDGNWRTDGSLSLTRQFGKERNLSFSTQSSFSFDHNVDMANIEGSVSNGLSTIRSLYLREQLNLTYSRKGWNLGGKVRGSYNRMRGSRSDFSSISACDYDYGLTARIPLPGQFGLSTDFTVFSRRGYSDPSLNTDHFVWNVRVERSILNGNLTFIADGFDILQNLSNVTRTVNAQGRTESYTNVIPSYFMGRVIYRLNKQPKKKKD